MQSDSSDLPTFYRSSRRSHQSSKSLFVPQIGLPYHHKLVPCTAAGKQERTRTICISSMKSPASSQSYFACKSRRFDASEGCLPISFLIGRSNSSWLQMERIETPCMWPDRSVCRRGSKPILRERAEERSISIENIGGKWWPGNPHAKGWCEARYEGRKLCKPPAHSSKSWQLKHDSKPRSPNPNLYLGFFTWRRPRVGINNSGHAKLAPQKPPISS